MTNLFVYGTLMYPEIVFALTGKYFRSQEAILSNYKRYAIRYGNITSPYPGIIPFNNSLVHGNILFDVDEYSLQILDFFEDSEY
ncbi:MAG: gamma-glutamylcyclotransferase family protein [Candidatus Absconditabacteria bacterium]